MLNRVRFAPSPTGNVHIGNIRVAIFNWLFARHTGGQFLLRIEDTDRERSTPEAIRNLLDAMEWLGLDYDEEAYFQSKNHERHNEAARAMVERGVAGGGGDGEPITLFLHADLFDASFVSDPREEARIDFSKGELFADCRGLIHKTVASNGDEHVRQVTWDSLTDLVLELEDGSELPGVELREQVEASCKDFNVCELQVDRLLGRRVQAIRFRRRYVFFDDLVMGRLEKPLDSLRDFVIVRSDGNPVFHLANVEDDVVMGITHVLRGNDHVENTFRHLFLFRALGARPPQYAHFPMIVNAKGKPYSKRDGDAYVGDFRDHGYLPDCLFNFLALCGWSPGDNREIMTRQEMIDAFSLDRAQESPAQFNLEKLNWMNGQYLTNMPAEKLLPLVREELARAGILAGNIDPQWLEKLVELQKEHMRTVAEFVENTRYFFHDEAVALDPKAVKKVLLKNEAQGLAVLRELVPVLENLPAWDEQTLETALTAFGESRGVGLGGVAQPLRVAVTGGTVSRGIWETLALLGREKTLMRVRYAAETVKAESE